jgi:2-dehydro-3-deoxygluconokinase
MTDGADDTRRPGPFDVVTLGEAFIGLIAEPGRALADSATFRRHVIGAEANVAVGLARLGRRVAFIGRVGSDGFGTAVRRRLRGEGVDVAWLVDDPAPTGLMLREQRALGPSAALYHRRGSAGSQLRSEDVAAAADAIRSARWLHVTGITPALGEGPAAAHARAIDLATKARVPVSFDINLRRLLWSESEAAVALRPLVARATVILGSPDELAVVAGTTDDEDGTGAAEAFLETTSATTVIVKRGAAGATLHVRDRPAVSVPAIAVARVVDPIGAGDACCAGYLAARLEGLGDEAALRWAVACGAAAVAVDGDMDGLPDRPELDRLLAAGGRDILR